MDSIFVPISVGELFDKITILEIKERKIKDNHKLVNIQKELSLLNNISKSINLANLSDLIDELKNINIVLWDIEERKREKEKLKCFDEEFIELARSVYTNNDKRAYIKKQINLLSNSSLIEEKSYE